MRLLRARRRDGAICVTVEVFGYEIEEMVRRGLLPLSQVQDRRAVRNAVGKIVENWFRTSWEARGPSAWSGASGR